MIGDRLYTDIALGINAGIPSICVLPGESSAADVKRLKFKPDFVVDSVKDLIRYLQ
jgi:ribonucleotide monophosphatase NagD (HAD superfamily)